MSTLVETSPTVEKKSTVTTATSAVDLIDSAMKASFSASAMIDFHGKRFIEVDDEYLRARKRSKKSRRHREREDNQITLAGCASSIFESFSRRQVPLSSCLPSAPAFPGTCSNKDLLELCCNSLLVSQESDNEEQYPQVSDEEESTAHGAGEEVVHDPLLQNDFHPVEEEETPLFVEPVEKKLERRASAPVQLDPPAAAAASAAAVSPNHKKLAHDRRCSMGSATLPPEYKTEKCLGEDFVPGKWDVVCGRGKNWSEHISNRRFRVLVAMNLKEYFETTSRTRKSIVINSIVNAIQTASGEGFVKKRGKSWYRITTKEAREKTSHCLRDCIPDPQHEQLKWTKEELVEKLMQAQDHVFRSLDLMAGSPSAAATYYYCFYHYFN